MKRSVDRKELPVSRKAYNRFRLRIHEVLGQDSEAEARMVTAFDLYLAGDRGYASGLSAMEGMAFSFLRQDIDAAIERSRKARERAALRKSRSLLNAAVEDGGGTEKLVDDFIKYQREYAINRPDFTPPMTRAERRMFKRGAGVRSTRWDHLRPKA
ncbi:hypothetical protein [uncultured Duncaniella sp.]|uniref:hypothetical protein n=1 Tax=uncultured Duncaniella sp. TaxID=2768039 RepID=UPI0025A96F17|nr:hypothetical protein [uncultured Duncaniella sp.]